MVHDKRRIDPETGAVRPEAGRQGGRPAGGSSGRTGRRTGAPGPGEAPAADQAAQARQAAEQAAQPGPGVTEPGVTGPGVTGPQDAAGLAAQLAERTADLQRLQAEYVNYRRRVERDRESVRELAVIAVLVELLPVLDDIGRARDHGELEGGFKSVAESLEGVAAKLGLERFGAAGEVFDPTVHEALMHQYSPEVAEATCIQILQPGYRLGTRVIRPARVAVAEPQHAASSEG